VGGFDATLQVLLLALAIDAIIGDPHWLWRRLLHPVALIGWGIAALDRALNRDDQPATTRRTAGIATVVILVGVSALTGYELEQFLEGVTGGWLVSALLASILIAQRSLYDHVAEVRNALRDDGLEAGRKAVSMIVGRDPASLDAAGVSRAAIESCAENFSDGIVAPAVWFALLGWPGLLIYKAINTADSMIGHRTARHEQFGWAAARLDDLLNLVPARLSAILIALAAPMANGSIAQAATVAWRDASVHRSPNAGWPESAMAGSLGIALAGPRRYAERTVDDPFLNAEGRRDANAGDIGRALRVYMVACVLHAAIYAAVVVCL
jgi:adenosylcobinamide-phosphate synthase